MSAPLVIGVDVGGTTIAAGAVEGDGRVVADEAAPTHRAGPGTALATMEAMIASVRATVERAGHVVRGIGVGVPGPVDAVAGRVGGPVPHVPELVGLPLAARLASRFAVPAYVDNDCNALALAEWRFGAARGARSLVVLAVGTGLGAGIVIEGRLVRGAAGFGGELGHTPVKFDGPPCWCGGRGCLAVYASGRGIAEQARARATPGGALLAGTGGDVAAITAPLVFRAAAAGDEVAVAIVDEACRALGAAIGTVVNGLNPDVVVLTGGVVQSLAPLEARIVKAAAEYAFAAALAATRLVVVPGDKRVTVRGAAALVLYETAVRAEGERLTPGS